MMNACRDWKIRPGPAEDGDEVIEQFSSSDWAFRWLGRNCSTPRSMAEIRRLLADQGYSYIHRFGDDAVLSLLASGVAIRRFRVVREEFPEKSGTSSDEGAPAPGPDAAAPPRTPPPQVEAVLEEPTFSPLADLLAIAEAQKEAAALGIPFCEECARKALANAQL